MLGEIAKFAFHSEFIGLSPLVFVSSVVVPSIGTSRLSRLGQTSHASFDEPELCEFPFEFFFFIFRSMRISTRFIRYPSELKKKKKRYGRYTREITKRFEEEHCLRCLDASLENPFIFLRVRASKGGEARVIS